MNMTGVSATHAAGFGPGQFYAEPLAVVLFSSVEAAEFNVAGLPAAARALREIAEAGATRCAIAIPGGWSPDANIVGELERLAGAMPYACADSSVPGAFDHEKLWLVAGEQLVVAPPPGETTIDRMMRHAEATLAAIGNASARAAAMPILQNLRRAGSDIVGATSKPGDGIVSRYINRPISQAISTLLLRFPAIRPIHATIGTALIAIAMTICLLLGGQPGLIAGAVLFQAASIIDGVDGEIARATFRTSARGAMLDSLIDAATNLAFIAGVAINLYLQGNSAAAMAGGLAMVLLAGGLTLIGRAAKASKRPFTFNGVKERVGAYNSRVMTCLTWLTMRDFFALAAAVLIIVGLAPLAMFAFAVVTVGWLVVVLVVLHRQPA